MEVCHDMGMEENKKRVAFLKAGEQVVFRKGGCAVALQRKEDELAGDFPGSAVSHFYGRGGKESRFYRGREN